jgi:predicted helicase
VLSQWPLQRTDRIPVGAAKAAIEVAAHSIAASAAPTKAAPTKITPAAAVPKATLKADKAAGTIALDAYTTLSGIPQDVWDYKLGNRSALEWILDQYKESKPRDPTIREKFNTYRFADHKEHVIDLLTRVTRVSVETQAIIAAMKAAPRDGLVN